MATKTKKTPAQKKTAAKKIAAPKLITDIVKTFEDACKVLNIQAKLLPDFTMLEVNMAKALMAHYKLIIIAKALNEGWEPNWNDSNEIKYTNYFRIEASKSKPAGFGFSGSYCGTWGTHTTVGSRLCFKSSTLAMYASDHFKDLFIDYFLIKK